MNADYRRAAAKKEKIASNELNSSVGRSYISHNEEEEFSDGEDDEDGEDEDDDEDEEDDEEEEDEEGDEEDE